MEQKPNITVVDYVRFIATISIVMWHCSICPIAHWGIVDHDMFQESAIFMPMKIFQTLFFPEAVMPLFTFISGFLFSFLIAKGKYGEFKLFLWNKTQRLIIPFFILGTLVTITSYDRYISDIPWGEGSHLWFCAMLFWCFMIMWPVVKLTPERYNKETLYLVLSLCIILQLYYGSNWTMEFRLPLGLHNSLYFLGYFVAGYLFYTMPKLIAWLRKNIIFLAIIYIACCLVILLGLPVIGKVCTLIHNYLYSFLLVALFSNCLLSNSKGSEFVKNVCKYSFGIYVFHEWISWNFCHIPLVKGLINEHFIIFSVINFVCVFMLSYLITFLMMKTKIGKYLL